MGWSKLDWSIQVYSFKFKQGEFFPERQGFGVEGQGQLGESMEKNDPGSVFDVLFGHGGENGLSMVYFIPFLYNAHWELQMKMELEVKKGLWHVIVVVS